LSRINEEIEEEAGNTAMMALPPGTAEQGDSLKTLAKDIANKSKLKKFTDQVKNAKYGANFMKLAETEDKETMLTLKASLLGDIERQMDDLRKLK